MRNRFCWHCEKPLPDDCHPRLRYCGKRCRHAAWWRRNGVGRPRRFPSREVLCAGGCGTVVLRTKTSAEEPMCKSCRLHRRREQQELRPERPPVRVAAPRAKPGGTTAERGYGAAHQRMRRALLAAFEDGQPCARCGRPMTGDQPLDLDHTDDRTGYLGLSHRRCNRATYSQRAA